MTHPAEQAAARCLAQLRAAPRPIRPEPGKPIVPQVYLSWDSAQAQVALDVAGDPAALLSLSAEITGTPRWMTLSIALGNFEFLAGEVLGLALQATGDLGLAPFVRSRLGQTTQDTGFGESLPAGTDARPAVLLRKLTGGDPMVGPAQFHTLILPLPRHSFRLRLVDLRLFVLPAALGAEPDLPRLGSFAL